MKCKELMYGDWVACEKNSYPMQITNVGDDYVYATFEGLEGDPWEFDDKDYQPSPIEITNELLVANGWDVHHYKIEDAIPTFCSKEENRNYLEWKNGDLYIWFDYGKDYDEVYSDILVPCKYVHQLQQVLRLAGMIDMANNFKL